MKKPMKKKLILATLSGVLLMGLVIAVVDASSYLQERDDYVEVGGGRIAYVPRTAQFVKVNGQVRRIIGFVSAVDRAGVDCMCPECCGGQCLQKISTNGFLGGRPVLVMAYIVRTCD